MNSIKSSAFLEGWRQERVEGPGTLSEVAETRRRRAVCAIAPAFAPLDNGPKYRWLLYPHDTEKNAKDFAASQLSCALFGGAVLRLAGADERELDIPYANQLGEAVTIIERIARRHGAWRDSGASGSPQPGDVAIIGYNRLASWSRGGSPKEFHVLVVTGTNGSGLWSVDGGQPGIREVERFIVRPGPRELWLGDPSKGIAADGRPAKGRRVYGWLDLGAFPLPREAWLPPGADLLVT